MRGCFGKGSPDTLCSPPHSALDGCGRLWDLRSGKCVLVLDSHLKSVLAIDFSSNGYRVIVVFLAIG